MNWNSKFYQFRATLVHIQVLESFSRQYWNQRAVGEIFRFPRSSVGLTDNWKLLLTNWVAQLCGVCTVPTGARDTAACLCSGSDTYALKWKCTTRGSEMSTATTNWINWLPNDVFLFVCCMFKNGASIIGALHVHLHLPLFTKNIYVKIIDIISVMTQSALCDTVPIRTSHI